MRRREFIAGVAAASAVVPLSVRAQQGDRVRRIGVVMGGDENDPEGKLRYSAFTQALADLGWTDSRNLRIDLRWGGADSNRIRALAQQLVGSQPDIILANSAAVTVALQRETLTIPIVFANVGDPVASGLVARLDRPGGNITGFTNLEATLGGKWLELLSEMAPKLKRAAYMFNPTPTPLNVRSSPNVRVVGTLENGMLVSVLDRTTDRRGQAWVYVGNAEDRMPTLADGTTVDRSDQYKGFLEALYHPTTSEPVHLIFDEADQWVPERTDTAPASAYMPSFETAARSLKVVPIVAPVHSDLEIETAIIALGREPRSGLVISPDVFTTGHRVPIILAAARNNVPAVYYLSDFARGGGLLSYGPDLVDTFRRAATYVDRILRGAKPGDLPVQFPAKYEMVVNLKTAKALGVTVPQSILLSADEVIE